LFKQPYLDFTPFPESHCATLSARSKFPTSKQLNMKTLLASTLALVTLVPAMPAAVLYDLDTLALDGQTGENTYLVSNSQTAPAGLTQAAGTNQPLVDTLGTSENYTYFVGYYSAATLTNIGDSITLTYSLTPSSATAFNNSFSGADRAFRVGFFNSNGTQMTANSATTGATALNNDTGYAATYRPTAGTVATNNSLLQRTSTSDILWSSGTFVTVSGAPTLVSPGTGDITGTFTLKLVSTGVEITSVINGGTAQSVIDTSGTITSFDSFSIFAVPGDTNPTLTFDALTVSTVPEPSAALLLLGGLAPLAFLRKRRQIA
jgi:hypothetical protein